MSISLPSRHLRLLGGLLIVLACLSMPNGATNATPRAANIAAVSSRDDFATQVLYDSWDLDNPDDIAIWHTQTLGNWNNATVSGGVLSATSTNADPRVFIRVPTPGGAVPAPYEGSYKPIVPASYRYATVRMFFDKTTAAQFVWQNRTGTFGTSAFETVNAGWNIITFDLTREGTGRVGAAWNSLGTADGFSLDPAVATGNFALDFVRLSQGLVAVPITWDPGGLSGNVDIYVGPDSSQKARIASVPASSGSFNWQTSLAPGSYSVFVQQGGSVVGGSPFTLPVNSTPQVEVTAPSFISGPDYASQVVGDSWDMSNPEDVASPANLTNVSFSNGIMRAQNVNGNEDGHVGLRVTTPIDTTRFRYATYRMQVDTLPSPLNAPVARYLWWNTNASVAGTTEDIVVYKGFRTVSFDLATIERDATGPGIPWNSSVQRVFRLDPHEYTQSIAFQLDYVMLTGNERADTVFNIRYNPIDADGTTPQVSLFYDTDAQGFNGTAISCTTAPTPVNGANPVYIPTITKGSPPPVLPSGQTCRWNTASLPNGTYYVYAVASDGLDSTAIYAEVPVEISH
ncbi:MAG: hypothetical protein OHK0022_13520 [Roseiflexaceae bacterium]